VPRARTGMHTPLQCPHVWRVLRHAHARRETGAEATGRCAHNVTDVIGLVSVVVYAQHVRLALLDRAFPHPPPKGECARACVCVRLAGLAHGSSCTDAHAHTRTRARAHMHIHSHTPHLRLYKLDNVVRAALGALGVCGGCGGLRQRKAKSIRAEGHAAPARTSWAPGAWRRARR